MREFDMMQKARSQPRTRILLAAALVLLCGCGDGSSAGSYTVGGTVSGLAAGESIVLANTGTDQISVAANGSFTFDAASPNGGAYAVSVTKWPAAKTCAVANGVGVVEGSAVDTVAVSCVAIPHYAYVSKSAGGSCAAYAIDANTGALTPSPGNGLLPLCGLTLDPNWQFAFLLAENAGATDVELSVYDVNAAAQSVAISAASPLGILSSTQAELAFGPIVDPFGHFAYVPVAYSCSMFGACYGAETQVYAIDAARGTLTPAVSTASVYSYQMVFTPSGNFAFSAEALLPGTGTPSGVLGFRVDAQTGALLPFSGNPFAAGTNPAAIAIDPTARFVYAANSGSDDMSAFTLDSAGASLAPIAGSPYATGGTSPVTIAIDPSGRFVYVVNSASANVSAFAIDPASGALSPLPGSPFMTGSAPNSIAFDPSGRFAYVANYADNTVSEFAIDAQSGVLTAIPGSPLATAAGPAITIK